jgi:ADP-ribosyl-[dinitrogen reductase] hydrolase
MPHTLTDQQVQAALGALLGSAAGDALGAPFEFRPAGTYLSTFPRPVVGGIGEMVGGGSFGWAPAEFTDDTQMAIAMAEALLRSKATFDPEVMWEHFQAWSKQASDIGNTTRASLSGDDYRTAASDAHNSLGHSHSNGSVMRSAPLGLLGVRWGRDITVDIARCQSALTHFDDVACWSSAIVAETIRALILGDSFESALQGALSVVDIDHRDMFEEVLAPNWTPHGDNGFRSNGLALVCLAQAVWAVRSTTTFEDAVVSAVNLGNDADTVAAVCGGLAGALYGIQRVPSRWITYLHGTVRQPDGRLVTYHQNDLTTLAHQLVGHDPRSFTPPEPVIAPREIHDVGVFASNLLGAETVDKNMAVVSLCRMEERLHHIPHRREIFILDQCGGNQNPHLDSVTRDAVDAIEAFLAEGREVLVHCHGGRSRTGFILKAWYMQRYGKTDDEAHDWIKERWEHYGTWNWGFSDFLMSEWGNK